MEKRYTKIRIRQLLKLKNEASKNIKKLVWNASEENFLKMIENKKDPVWYWVRVERRLQFNLIGMMEY